MIAFLSRFWLDAQNTDLTEELESKQAVLASSLKFEKRFKDTQNRLKIYADLTSDKLSKATVTNTISTLLPPDIFLTTIAFSQQGVAISGMSPSERSIQQLLVNLNASDIFNDTQLMGIKSDEEDVELLTFDLMVSIEKEDK